MRWEERRAFKQHIKSVLGSVVLDDDTAHWISQLGFDTDHALVQLKIIEIKNNTGDFGTVYGHAIDLMNKALPPKTLNLTPHDIVILNVDGTERLRYPKSNIVVRMAEKAVQMKPDYDGVSMRRAPVFTQLVFEPNDFDPKKLKNYDGVIVAMPVGQFVQEKSRHMEPCREFAVVAVLGPDTSPGMVVRDDAGRIMGVRGLVCYI